ncbi:MAG TPA: PorV/PorQ family protein [Candidatus Ozemobacteraceae bacterium]|nr:PorV/PorQ family protein [Candidatus Ozemobacteraceae bacterium]
MSKIRNLLLLAALVVASAVPVSADSAGQAGAFLKMGVGARALGMGSAFTAIADDSTAAFWNPAGLATLEKSEASFMHANLTLDRTYNFLNYAHVMKDEAGKKKYTVALSHIRFGIDGIPETRVRPDGNPMTDQNGGYTAGAPVYIFSYFDDTETATFGTYARKLGERLYGGVNVKRLNQDLFTNSADSWGLDLGFLYKSSDRGMLGLSIRDIGESLKWDTDSGHSDRVPVTTTFGASYKTSDRMTVAVDLNKVEHLDAKFRAGTEFWLNDNAAVRMGSQAGDLTLGASFKLDTWRFDYSYVDETLGEAHRMSASKQF